MRLLDPKKFAEGQQASQASIELKDDDEAAVEAMLRWLYTFDYEECRFTLPRHVGAKEAQNVNLAATLDFHLAVCVVGDKYMLRRLGEEALDRLRKVLAAANDNAVVRLMKKLHDTPHPQSVVDLITQVRDSRLHTLIRNQNFRAHLRNDPELALAVIDKIRALSEASSRLHFSRAGIHIPESVWRAAYS